MVVAYIEWMFHFASAVFATGLALFLFSTLVGMLYICGLSFKEWWEREKNRE